MKRKMKITGVAPMIAVPTLLYLTLTILITYLSGDKFKITSQSSTLLIIAGSVLILFGAVIVANCGKMLLKSFSSEKLMTDGLYKIFRNPMYAAYLLFIIPGIALLFNSWLALTTVLVNYTLFSVFIKREYVYLYEKYGVEYEDYLAKVIIKFL